MDTTTQLPVDPMAFVARAAAATFRDTGAHATSVILGWRLYLALERASRPERRLFRVDIAEEESMETLLGMRIVVDPESEDRCTTVLGAARTALQLAWRPIPPDPRDAQIASLEAEVARLEALIVEADDTQFAAGIHLEADRIRSRAK